MGHGIGPYIKRERVENKLVETLVRDLVFDSVKTFSELFSRAQTEKAQGLIYCTVRDQRPDQPHRSLYVEPTDMVRDFVKKNMHDLVGVDTYYEMVIYEDGTTLVLAKYQSIIGSRWLADIRTDSIPFKE